MAATPVRLALLAVLLLSAGCAEVGLEVGGTTTQAGEGDLATVETVIDGDTIEVRFPDGSTDTVRLLGVDTPETHGENSPGEFEGVPDTAAGRDCLRAAGEHVTREVVVPRIEGEQVRLRGDPEADARGAYDRRLAYVVHDGTNLNRLLVERGWARVYDAPLSRLDTFYDLEAAAQDAGRGLWTCRDRTADPTWSTAGATATATAAAADGPLALAAAHPDAAGHDGENLRDEYVVLANRGSTALALGGWTVSDAADHTYTVPSGFSLGAGERVRLVTGTGVDNATTLFWNASAPIWNNGGDTLTVRAGNGSTMLVAAV